MRAVGGAGSAVALLLASGLIAEAAITDKLVSRNSQGTPANGSSFTDASNVVSRDGKLVAFSSQAANLPGGDGSVYQSYVRNMTTGKTRLVSTKNNGEPAETDAQSAAISADGRSVGFFGKGEGLPGADGIHDQAWIHDLSTGRTRLVSKSNKGDPGNGYSDYPSLSANGRFVTFSSTSDNLPGGDGSNQLTYMRDLRERRTILVSRTNKGDPAYGSDVFGQSISSDGRHLIFESNDSDLQAGDGSTEHIYMRNLGTRHTSLIDRNSAGKPGNDSGYYPSISGNGRFVGFESIATNLPAGDGTHRQAYLRDLKTGKTRLVAQNNQGQPQDNDAYYPHPSDNARYVTFNANASNLPGGDGTTIQIYVRDMQEGITRLLSRAANGDPADANCDNPSISLDGRFAAFMSEADNLGGDPSYSNVFRAGRIR
jgi:hypothetical protein